MSFKPEFKNLRAHRNWNLFILRDNASAPIVEKTFIQTVQYSGAGFLPPANTTLVPVRNQFVALLSSYGTATFEEQTSVRVDLTAINAAITGGVTGNINIIGGPIIDPDFPPLVRIDDRTINGRFNTTPAGAKFAEISRGAVGQLDATFTPNIAKNAIGFYLSDVSDFTDDLTITVNTSSGSLSYLIPNPNPASYVTFAMFFAVCLVGRTVNNVYLSWTNRNDVIGVDDIILGDYP